MNKNFTPSLICFFALLLSTNLLQAQVFKDRLIQKVKRSVVRIVVEEPAELGSIRGLTDKKSELYFRQLVERTPTESFGTGFCYTPPNSKEVYLITNEHVVVLAKQGKLKAIIAGKKYNLEIVGADTFYDLAVLRFSKSKKSKKHHPPLLPSLSFSKKELKELQAVCVVAAPNGGTYVTDGKISGINVDRTGVSGHKKYIEHNALIIKGCSGSPLIDTRGEVIGINTRYSREQLNLSYALNGGLAQKLIHQIINSAKRGKVGRVIRPFLGIEFEQEFEYTGMTWDGRKGIKIKSLLKNSPAANSQLATLLARHPHYLIKLNSQPVENLYELLEALEKCKPGAAITLSVAENHLQGKVKKLVIRPERLTRNNLKKIGIHFLQKYNLEAKQTTGLLAISGRFNHRCISVNQGNQSARGLYYERDADGLSTHQAYAGSPYESTIKYQIRDFVDLGVLVRLCGLEGRVALYSKESVAEKIITMQIAEYEETSARVLYF